jgi:hypothetical protein
MARWHCRRRRGDVRWEWRRRGDIRWEWEWGRDSGKAYPAEHLEHKGAGPAGEGEGEGVQSSCRRF